MFNLKTPGREVDKAADVVTVEANNSNLKRLTQLATSYIAWWAERTT